MVDVGFPVVLVDAPGFVVVVDEPPVVEVVVVVTPPVVLVVEDDGWVVLVVVVLVDDVVVDVVVVVVAAGAGGFPLTTPPRVVPVPASPKMEASGLPAISSTTVTKSSAARKTTPAVPATAFQVKRCDANGAAEADATSRWVAGVPAVALTSSGAVRSDAEPDASICVVSSVTSCAPDAAAEATASVGTDDSSTLAALAPPAAVPPSLRRTESSGARTTTCLTASCPRSIDWATSAVPIVAAAEPMATPTMVPFTPKADAITAARTAPTTEARIWRNENFTGD